MRPINQGFNIQFTQNRCIRLFRQQEMASSSSSYSTFPPFWHTRTQQLWQQQLTTTSLRLISLSVGWSTVVHGRTVHDLRQGLQQFLGIFGHHPKVEKSPPKLGDRTNQQAIDWKIPKGKYTSENIIWWLNVLASYIQHCLTCRIFFPSRNSHYNKHMQGSTWEIIDSMFRLKHWTKQKKTRW